MKLTFSFSPCPNDCFMFEAIANRRIDSEGLEFSIRLADVESLNKAAFNGSAEVTKVSYHAYAYCAPDYVLLNAGSVLGRNCGPLLVSKRTIPIGEVARGRLKIAIPGKYTTANLLLSLAFPQVKDKSESVFSAIESAVLEDQYDAGVIIHESRFTYEAKGLKKIIDLGEFWETETFAPLPLAGIVIKRAFPDELKRIVNRVLRRSVGYAVAHPDASRDFVRTNARELNDDAINQHIDLYVNSYSLDLREEGRRAVRTLFAKAEAAGIIREPKDLFFRASQFN